MGKLAKKKKNKNISQSKQTTWEDASTEFLGGLVSPTELEETILTLETFVQHSDLLSDSKCKRLRQILYTLSQNKSSSLQGRISDALRDERWWDALGLLEELRIKKIQPKLGSVQRWVRDCDAAAASLVSSNSNATEMGDLVLRVLDGIIRAADPQMIGVASNSPLVSKKGSILMKAPFSPEDLDSDIGQKLVIAHHERFKDAFKILYREAGTDRNPPNHHDMILYTSANNTIACVEPPRPVTRVDVPNLPGVFILKNVLSIEECRQMISAAETIGFTPDQPSGGTAKDKTSVLAHNFFWLADDELLDRIWNRCHELLPQEVSGQKIGGLNARWRLYRYTPGSIYRPHIDGAWPGSIIDRDGNYVYDGYGDRWSKLTFLIRLNDEFEGGATTYFTPSSDVGFMDATPVLPKMGDVLVFPHGATEGSILHEGSPVLDTGGRLIDAKYVIRTEVLYIIPGHQKLDLK